MLKISPAVTVIGVPGAITKNNYTLYPDSEDKNIYYALAENPTYQPGSDGGPSFNLIWYFGAGVTPAGICTLTVGLPMPDMNRPEVQGKITAALTSDQSTRKIAQDTFELCRAIDAKDAAKANALKAALGLNDGAAAAKKAVFKSDQGWEQFLPLKGDLSIRPIPFKSGSVTVQAFASPSAYQDGTPEFSTGKIQTTPSLVNSNAAVVTFNLKDLGVNLFWHGLGGWLFDPAAPKPAGYDAALGGSSVITVTYNIAFDGMLPEAKATVTLDKSVFAKLDIESVERRGSWGRTYRQDVARGKEYNDAITSATNIVLPAVASKEDKDSVQKLLTDWAAKQLEDMTKAQLPAVKLEDLNVDTIRSLKTVSTQSRTYTLTQAVTVPKNPQAQLPKIDGLVDKGSLPKYFQLINLNDKPYFDVDLTVRPPSLDYLKVRSVERFVVTQLSYAKEKLRTKAGKEVNTLEYVPSVAPPPGPPTDPTLSGTFDRNTPDRSLEYSYLVAYTDGTPSLRVAANKQSGDDNYLDLGGVDIGILSVSLDGIDLPWDVIGSAKVDLKYGDWEKSVALKKDDKPLLVVKPFGQAMTKPLTYKLTLNLTAGTPQVGPEITVTPVRGHADITLRNPLGDMLNPLAFGLDTAVTKAQLRVEYTLRSSGPDRIFDQLVQLDSTAAPTYIWRVPVFSGFPAAFKVTKARVTTNGAAKDLTDLSGGTKDPVPQSLSITVQADGISDF